MDGKNVNVQTDPTRRSSGASKIDGRYLLQTGGS